MSEQTLKLVERYNRALAELETATIARIEASLDAALRDLERELAAKYPLLIENSSLLVSQQQILIAQELGDLLQVVRPELAPDYEALMQNTLALTSQTGASLAEQLIAAIAPGSPIGNFAGIPVEALALSAKDTYATTKTTLARHNLLEQAKITDDLSFRPSPDRWLDRAKTNPPSSFPVAQGGSIIHSLP